MHMATKTRRWTRADLASLPDDGNRYEVLDGELFVTPQAAYRHQYIARDLAFILHAYCRRYGIGEVVGPGAVIFGKNELQPDVQVIPGHHPPLADTKWEDLPTPLLVVEILSESTARRDVGKKRAAYLRIDIPTYWVVDADKHRVLAWSPVSSEPTIVTDTLHWHAGGDLPPLEIPLASFLPAPQA